MGMGIEIPSPRQPWGSSHAGGSVKRGMHEGLTVGAG